MARLSALQRLPTHSTLGMLPTYLPTFTACSVADGAQTVYYGLSEITQPGGGKLKHACLPFRGPPSWSPLDTLFAGVSGRILRAWVQASKEG